jgi:hypothetical protein
MALKNAGNTWKIIYHASPAILSMTSAMLLNYIPQLSLKSLKKQSNTKK